MAADIQPAIATAAIVTTTAVHHDAATLRDATASSSWATSKSDGGVAVGRSGSCHLECSASRELRGPASGTAGRQRSAMREGDRRAHHGDERGQIEPVHAHPFRVQRRHDQPIHVDEMGDERATRRSAASAFGSRFHLRRSSARKGSEKCAETEVPADGSPAAVRAVAYQVTSSGRSAIQMSIIWTNAMYAQKTVIAERTLPIAWKCAAPTSSG